MDHLQDHIHVISDYDSKYTKYHGIFNLIKLILNLENNISKKLTFLKDIFYGLDAIIFTCGPSSKNYDKNIIKKLQDSYVIISNKYIIRDLKKQET